MTSLAEKISHPFISYSLKYEDVILRRLFPMKTDGFFIDVGAAHPIVDNDLYGLYRLGWRGINVEANAELFHLLQTERSGDLNVNAPISDLDGMSVTFFQADNIGLSTCDQTRAAELGRQGYKLSQHVMTTVSLRSICAQSSPSQIDILKVDVEGLEEAVFAGNDWQRFRPSVIVFETTLPETQTRCESNVSGLLRREGYRHIHFDGLNDFYACSIFPVPDGLSLPINGFDGFIRREQTVAAERLASLHKELASLEGRLMQMDARLVSNLEELGEVISSNALLKRVYCRIKWPL